MNHNYTSTRVTVGTSETAILARDNNRKALILHNQDTSTDIDVYFESDSNNFITIAAGATFEFEKAPQNALNGVVASGTANLTVMHA